MPRPSTPCRPTLAFAVTLSLVMADPDPLFAQRTDRRPPPTSMSSPTEPVERGRGPWWTLWSRRTPHDRIIAGMVTVHVYNFDRGIDNNEAVGLIEHGILGATFITTHGPRGFVLAAERSWIEGRWGPAETMLGFRAGLVYGYDRRLFEPAEWTPVLPYAQPVALIRLGPVSLDLAYTWIVTSLTAGVTLW